jgi:hypothetical protein
MALGARNRPAGLAGWCRFRNVRRRAGFLPWVNVRIATLGLLNRRALKKRDSPRGSPPRCESGINILRENRIRQVSGGNRRGVSKKAKAHPGLQAVRSERLIGGCRKRSYPRIWNSSSWFTTSESGVRRCGKPRSASRSSSRLESRKGLNCLGERADIFMPLVCEWALC